MIKIFINGNVPSSKNSRRNFKGKSLPSKATVRWRLKTAIEWKRNKKAFLKMIEGRNKPYHIHFGFVRGTKHHFDYLNPAQTIQDEMVRYGWLDDDDADNIIPYFQPYEYSKEKPGVYIFMKELDS